MVKHSSVDIAVNFWKNLSVRLALSSPSPEGPLVGPEGPENFEKLDL